MLVYQRVHLIDFDCFMIHIYVHGQIYRFSTLKDIVLNIQAAQQFADWA